MSRVPVLVLELTDQKNSSYALEETMGTPDPKYLSAPSKYFLPTRSVERQSDGSYRKLRYIAGCDTPYVDEQEARKVYPNPQDDIIEFENGALTVPRTGRNIGLYEYLKKCEFNEDNKSRPEGATVKFKELNSQEDATKNITQTMLELQALNKVLELGVKTQNGYEWDKNKIDYLCDLFLIGGIDSYEEKVEQLTRVAKARPQAFLETINQQTGAIRVDIAAAIRFNVINTNGESASFTDNSMKFYTFKSKNQANKVEELVEHCLTGEGINHHKRMVINTNAAKQREAEAVQ